MGKTLSSSQRTLGKGRWFASLSDKVPDMPENPTSALRKIRNSADVEIGNARRIQIEKRPEGWKIVEAQNLDELLPLCRNAATASHVTRCYKLLKQIKASQRDLAPEKLEQVLDALREPTIRNLDKIYAGGLCNISTAFALCKRQPDPDLLAKFQSELVSRDLSLNTGHVSSIIWSFAMMGIAPSESVWKVFDSSVHDTVSSAWSENIASMLWACTVLDIIPEQRTFAAVSKRLLEVAEFLEPGQVYDLIWANAKLSQPLPKGVMDMLIQKLFLIAQTTKVSKIAGSLQGLARSERHPGEQTLQMFCNTVTSTASTLPPYRISSLTFSFGRLGAAPDEKMLLALGTRALETMPEFSGQDVSNFLQGWLKLCPPAVPGLLEALEARLLAIMHQLTPKDLSKCLWACTWSDRRLGPEVLQALITRSIDLKDTFNGHAVCKLMRSLSKLPDGLVTESVVRALGSRALETRDDLRADHVCDALHLYGRVGVEPSPAMLEFFSRFCTSKVAQFTVHDVAAVMSAHAALKMRPSEALLRQLTTRVEELQPGFVTSVFVSLIQSHRSLGIEPCDRLLHALTHDLRANAKELRHVEVVQVLASCAHASIHPGSEVLHALEERLQFTVHYMKHDDISTLMWAYAQIRVQPSTQILDAFSAHLHTVLKDTLTQDEVSSMLQACASLNIRTDTSFYKALTTMAHATTKHMAGENSPRQNEESTDRQHDTRVDNNDEHTSARAEQAESATTSKTGPAIHENLSSDARNRGSNHTVSSASDVQQAGHQDVQSASSLDQLLRLCTAQQNDGERILQIYAKVLQLASPQLQQHEENHEKLRRILDSLRNDAMAHIEACTPRELNTILLAYAVWRCTPEKHLNEAITARMTQVMTGFTVNTAAVALWAYAQCRITSVGKHVIDGLLAQFLHGIDKSAPLGISNVLWALTKLKHSPSAELVSAMYHRLTQIPDKFSAQNIAKTLSGFARLDQSVSKAASSPEAEGVLMLRDRAHALLHELTSQGLADLVLAYGKLDTPLSEEHLSALDAAFRAKIGSFHVPAQEACDVLWFLAKRGRKAAYAHELVSVATSRVSEYNAKQIGTVLWSCQSLGIELNDRAFESLAERVNSLRPAQLPVHEVHTMIKTCDDMYLPKTNILRVTLDAYLSRHGGSDVDLTIGAILGINSTDPDSNYAAARDTHSDILNACTFTECADAVSKDPTCERIALGFYKCQRLTTSDTDASPEQNDHSSKMAAKNTADDNNPAESAPENDQNTYVTEVHPSHAHISRENQHSGMDTAVQQLEALALGKIRSLNTRQICAILHAYALCRVHPSKIMASRCLSHIAHHAHALSRSQVTHLLRSFVSLKLRPSESVLVKLSQRFIVHEDTTRAPVTPSVESMVSILYLYAQLGTRPVAELLDMYTERVLKSLFRLNANTLADFMWALAVFDRKPGTRDMPMVLKRAHELFLAKPNSHHPEKFVKFKHRAHKVVQVQFSLAKFQVKPFDELRRALEESIVTDDGQITAEDVARILWSNSVLYDDMDAGVRGVIERETSRLRVVPTDSAHLKMMLAGYVNMKTAWVSSSASAMIMVSMRACIPHNITAVDFAEVLDMIACLHVPVFAYLHDQLCHAALLKTRELDAKSAVTVLYALHRLGVPLTSEYMDEVGSLLVANMQDMHADHVCKILQALSALEHTGSSWRDPGVQILIGALEARAEQVAPNFTREERREMVLAFSALNLQEKEWMRDDGDA
jgi:hypothetical protein